MATPGPRSLDEITDSIIDAAFGIHRRVGPGLLESIYEAMLEKELKRRGLRVERQRPIPCTVDGVRYTTAFRADLIVENQVLVELKAQECLARVHSRQVSTYLQVTNLRVGLLINFGALLLRDGLKRIVNGLDPADSPALRVNRET